MKKHFFIIALLLCNFFVITAQESIKSIEVALKKGEAKIISKYFSENIDLEISEQSDIFTKNEAENILSKFFSSENVINFEPQYKGQKENCQYLIGSLKTTKKTYRVTILLKDNFIIQLRIQIYEFKW